LTLPAAVALIVIAEPVIAVLFGRGAFEGPQILATAAALEAYAYGLPAYVLIKALAPGFFAREDTKTPVIIASCCMGLNLVLNLVLMGPFLHVGIAMATAISSWVNAGIMAFVLHRRGHLVLDDRLKGRFLRTLWAVFGLGLALAGGMKTASAYFDGPELTRIIALIVVVGGGCLVFALLATLIGAARPSDLKGLLSRNEAPHS
jgi:putative peptidoglycan lipid II flippase